MKKYLLVLSMMVFSGCHYWNDDVELNGIKVNGKPLTNQYALSMYETKPDRSFSIMIDNKTYLKFVLVDNNIQEGIFESAKVKIVDDGKSVNPYAVISWGNITNKDFNSYQEAFSNATDVSIYIINHASSPLNAEY